MRILHKCAWTRTELENFRAIITENVWEGLRIVATHMKTVGVTVSRLESIHCTNAPPQCSSAENLKKARYIMEMTEKPALSGELERIEAFCTKVPESFLDI